MAGPRPSATTESHVLNVPGDTWPPDNPVFVLTSKRSGVDFLLKTLDYAHASSASGAPFNKSRVDRHIGKCLSMSSTNRLLWVRSTKCVISCTTMYSKHTGSFFASSILNQRLLVSGLQVPHLVFIRRTVQLRTGDPMRGSHLVISGGIAALS